MSYPFLMAETAAFLGHNGDHGEAYYARPTRAGQFPGMVVIHHLPGWDEWIIEVTRKFALMDMRLWLHIFTFATAPAIRTTSEHGCGRQAASRTIRWWATWPGP